jgi:hypothetical protein
MNGSIQALSSLSEGCATAMHRAAVQGGIAILEDRSQSPTFLAAGAPART